MTVTRRAVLLLCWLLPLLPAGSRAATFLFDATKAETVANADWVIDEDNHVAARYPTPPASGITASTPETYWTGALSSWGVALVQMGHNVEQLPVGGRITYGDTTNAQDLSNYQVYVVCEPNILFTAAEKFAIASFVQSGGSLFVISDHAGSDRNNDGYDSVAIWNDFFSNNGVQANPFGVAINSTDISLVSSYVDTATDDPLTNGPLGPVALLKYSDGATLTMNPTANATVRAAFWSSATHTNSNVMAAWGTFGAGRFVVECDSSPPDDGTGSSGHTLYTGWTEEGVNHSRLFLNASIWLASVQSGGAPYNDNFAHAAPLAPGTTGAAGTSVGATKETGEPNHAGNAGGASVWWQFTAANTGTATISTAGSDFDTLLAVYTGTSVANLTAVAGNDNADGSHLTSAASFPVTVGTVYHVAVDGTNGASGHVTLVTSFPAPANDNFVNATAVSFNETGTTALALTGDNFNATAETGEPSHAGYTGGRSVWWKWTAPASGGVTISTLNSDFDTLLAVYTGNSVSALTAVASNANYGSSLQSLAGFNAVAGTTYRVAVDGYAGAAGNVVLTFTPGNGTSAPVNDNFANAAVLTGTSATATVANTNATKETGEPSHGNNSGGHSVWWRWTAPANGNLTVSTVGSSFDTTMGVYTGTAVNALTTFAEDDDSGGNLTSLITLPGVTAGTTYAIAVDGYGSATGTITFHLTFTATTPPANDNFANAAVLTGTTTNTTGTTVNATVEAKEPSSYGNHTVWWKWTAPADLVVTLTTGGSTVPSLGVFTGTSVDALSAVVSATGNQAVFQAGSGITYFFQLGADINTGAAGGVSLGLASQPLPTVSLAATTPIAAERGQVPGVFTFALSAPVSIPVTVYLDLYGNATFGDDYATAPALPGTNRQSLTIPANQASATLTITPVDDNDPTEGDESVFVFLEANLYYRTVDGANNANLTIQDDTPYTSNWFSFYRSNGGFAGAAAAPLADPDQDGIPNLLEFAFNLNPLAADDPTALPVLGIGTFADAAGTSRRFATLTFTRRTDAPNLTYSVEATSDLSAGVWNSNTPVFVSSTTAGMAANTERAEYRAGQPMDGPNAAPRQFLRVRVSTAPPASSPTTGKADRLPVSAVSASAGPGRANPARTGSGSNGSLR